MPDPDTLHEQSSGAEDTPPDRHVANRRTLFGPPKVNVAPVLEGSSADVVVSNPRIAIIDDEPINIKVAQKHLEAAGYRRFATTTDSRTAIELIAAEAPDVVLLDVMMPHVGGLEILESLRGDKRFVDLPVIILTAASDKQTKLEALRRGATEFLGKPVDSVELAARLRNVLAVKAHQDRLKRYAWDLELEVAARTVELAQAHEEVLACLAHVGEFRDNDTGRHVHRVGRYSEIIARGMGLDEETARRIGQAAPLHDIGKVGIPDAILLKPGKLDELEWEQMKQHAEYGQNVCAPTELDATAQPGSHAKIGFRIAGAGRSPILKTAASIAATHHERWDGKGYPKGLAGTDIPVEGRVVAVADVFDALTSNRPYKKAFPLEQSLEMIQEGAGSQFDPDAVAAFLAAKSEVVEVYRSYHDDPETELADRAAAGSA
jgi:putative two-component system response regulator